MSQPITSPLETVAARLAAAKSAYEAAHRIWMDTSTHDRTGYAATVTLKNSCQIVYLEARRQWEQLDREAREAKSVAECPTCHGLGFTTSESTFCPGVTKWTACPHGCWIPRGLTQEQALARAGIVPSGQSLVEPTQRNHRTVLTGESL